METPSEEHCIQSPSPKYIQEWQREDVNNRQFGLPFRAYTLDRNPIFSDWYLIDFNSPTLISDETLYDGGCNLFLSMQLDFILTCERTRWESCPDWGKWFLPILHSWCWDIFYWFRANYFQESSPLTSTSNSFILRALYPTPCTDKLGFPNKNSDLLLVFRSALDSLPSPPEEASSQSLSLTQLQEDVEFEHQMGITNNIYGLANLEDTTNSSEITSSRVSLPLPLLWIMLIYQRTPPAL